MARTPGNESPATLLGDETDRSKLPPVGNPRPPRSEDPAQQALADALQTCFRLLKYAMVVFLVIYLGSGIFFVREQQRAVELRFGRIVGEPGKQVYDPGWHFGLPYPIGEPIMVPVSPQTMSINQAFWWKRPDTARDAGRTDEELEPKAGPLNPLEDGSLLTGDANIVHIRFDVSFQVNDPAAYVTHVGNEDKARSIIRVAVERAMVHAVAQIEADEVIRGRTNQDRARQIAQAMLDDLGTGLQIVSFNVRNTAMPARVADAYREVSNAQSDKARALDEAWQYHTRTLNSAVGASYNQVLELLEQYEAAASANDAEQVAQFDAAIEQSFRNLALRGDPALRVGGEAAAIIREAETYRTQIVERVTAEAAEFALLLEQYRKNPRIFLFRRWQETRDAVFGSPDVEIFRVSSDDIVIQINRDPALQRQREEAGLRPGGPQP